MKNCLVLLIVLILIYSPVLAADSDLSIDISKLTNSELNAFADEIDLAIKKYHTPEDTVNDVVLSATQRTVESDFAEKGIEISWAWLNYTYSRDWDFYTVSTHIDYKDINGKKQKDNVYAELFPVNGQYTVFYLLVGTEVIINQREELPDTRWSKTPEPFVNTATNLNLSTLDVTELRSLRAKIRNEIGANHTPRSTISNLVLSLTQYDVEQNYAKQGIDVSWTWFDYTYTCDWDFYTLTTPINFVDANGNRQYVDVYAEAYPSGDKYALYYLAVGDQIIKDDRDLLPDDLSVMLEPEQYTPTPTLTAAPTPTATPTPTPTPQLTTTPEPSNTLESTIEPTNTRTPDMIETTPTLSPNEFEETNAYAYEELKKGDKGESVLNMQKRLNELGYSVGTADGDFGNKTQSAILDAQRNNNLPDTGIASIAFLELLFSEDARTAEQAKLVATGAGFTRESAKRAAIVAFTNRYAPDVFKDDKYTYDLSKFHRYSDVSGFYMLINSEGTWSKKNESIWHVDHLKLQTSEYNTFVDASLDVSYNGEEYIITNLSGKAPSYDDISVFEKESDFSLFFRVAQELIKENRDYNNVKSASVVQSPKKLREDVAKRAFEYVGEHLYPYGFQCHWFTGLIKHEQSDDGSWYFVVSVTITNQYGASRKATAEAYINNTTEAVENFIVY